MSNTNKPGMGFEVNIRSESSKANQSSPPSDTPFCIAIMGDFSGRFDQVLPTDKPLAKRKFIEIDRDNFEEVLQKLNVQLRLNGAKGTESAVMISIKDLEDFHPDALYEKLEEFGKLRSLRNRLNNKSSFDAAANEVMGWLVEGDPKTPQSASVSMKAQTPVTPPANLMDDVLSSTHQASNELEYLTSPGGLQRLIKDIVSPYVEPGMNPRQPEMVKAVDEATAEHMRRILHHPRFQALEALWRAVYFLVTRIETDRHLKIYLLDVSRAEVEADLENDVAQSALHKLFCDPSENDTPWSVIAGDYLFEDTINDILLLSQIGAIAQGAGGVFIAGAKETLAGCESFAKYPDVEDWTYTIKPGVANAWQSLRQDTVAEYISLALPRFILRLPYGEKSNPIESFKFEELAGDKQNWHAHILWGNAAFIKVEQLARAFSVKGWEMQPSECHQIDNLSMYYYMDEGSQEQLAAAEIFLTESGGKKILDQGLIPVWSVKNIDSIRSSDFTSLSANRT